MFSLPNYTRISDVYSLGLVIYGLFANYLADLAFKNMDQFNNIQQRHDHFDNRISKVQETFTALKDNSVGSSDKHKSQVMMELGNLIMSMLNVNSDTRIDIFQVVDWLERLVEIYDQNSVYLEDNENWLFSLVYPNYKKDMDILERPLYDLPSENSMYSFVSAICCLNKKKKEDPIAVSLGETYKRYLEKLKEEQISAAVMKKLYI